MSAEEVAKAFTAHYFSTFDSNASGLAGLFVSLIYPVRSVAGSCRQYITLLFHKAEAKLPNKEIKQVSCDTISLLFFIIIFHKIKLKLLLRLATVPPITS